jgi:hypothetical protein
MPVKVSHPASLTEYRTAPITKMKVTGCLPIVACTSLVDSIMLEDAKFVYGASTDIYLTDPTLALSCSPFTCSPICQARSFSPSISTRELPMSIIFRCIFSWVRRCQKLQLPPFIPQVQRGDVLVCAAAVCKGSTQGPSRYRRTATRPSTEKHGHTAGTNSASCIRTAEKY